MVDEELHPCTLRDLYGVLILSWYLYFHSFEKFIHHLKEHDGTNGEECCTYWKIQIFYWDGMIQQIIT